MSTKDKDKVMNAETRRILCATDLSGNCDHIYSYAMNLAGERDAGLMVIHVISQRSIKVAKTLAYYLNESQKDVVKEKTISALQRMKAELSSFLTKEIKDHPEYPGLIEHMLVYPGTVADEILEKANRFGCEAIVLGSRGTSGLKRLFRCGTAKKVIGQTKKPVFLVSMKHGKINISKYNLK
jgi:nucleotide-binding universal stress UspA family protein